MAEVCNKFWSLDIALVLPGILFIAIPLPLNEELQIICSHLAVQHYLTLKCFSPSQRTGRGSRAVCCLEIGSKEAGVSLITGKMW